MWETVVAQLQVAGGRWHAWGKRSRCGFIIPSPHMITEAHMSSRDSERELIICTRSAGARCKGNERKGIERPSEALHES